MINWQHEYKATRKVAHKYRRMYLNKMRKAKDYEEIIRRASVEVLRESKAWKMLNEADFWKAGGK